MATYTFRNLLADNPLAARCADILGRVLPPQPGNPDMGFSIISGADLMAEDFDLSSWSMDPTDMLNSFGWTDFAHGI